MDTNLQPMPDAERTAGSLERDCYATGRGWADGYKDGAANKYQPQCCIYGLGTPERDRWREAYERGWNAGNEKWHNNALSQPHEIEPQAKP